MNKLKIILQCNLKFIILFIFLFIYVIVFTQIIEYKSLYSLDETKLEGKITSYSINGNVLKLDIKGKEKVKATYYIKSLEEKEWLLENIVLGSNISLDGEFKEPINNTIPNTFNYKKYLYNQKIYFTFTIQNYKLNSDNNLFYKIKDYLLKRIYELPNNDYLLIFILGDKSLINNEEYQSFQLNGTAHLLAISGMHIGVLISLINFILGIISNKKRFLIITIILIFFAFLTSFSASVNRVILFFVLLNINKIKDWKLSNLQILFITGAILILINPFIVYNYGFLYSMIITAGIIYYSNIIKGSYFSKLIKLSTITFLFSLPITAVLNYEINLMSIIANLLFVPLVSFVIYPWSLITIIIPNYGWNLLIELLVYLSNLFQKFSIIINIPKMPIYLIILYYIFLILLKKNRKIFIGLVLIIFFNKALTKMDYNYYVYYLDVGQGDSSVLISPYKREIIMIDTGGKMTYEKESWTVSSKKYYLSANAIKFLKSLGITKIDYLILSHGDYDHMGEAINLVNNFKVDKVVFNNGGRNELEEELIKVLDKKKIKYYQGINELMVNKNKLYFLNTNVYDNENDNSNVLYFNYNNYKYLFMGDAGSNVEKNLLEKYNINDIDFLKVGHHGSNTSSSKYFIDRIKPKYSLISVGKNNRYGHPKESVLDTLANTKIYRTDIDGSIEIKLNNNGYKIRTCQP